MLFYLLPFYLEESITSIFTSFYSEKCVKNPLFQIFGNLNYLLSLFLFKYIFRLVMDGYYTKKKESLVINEQRCKSILLTFEGNTNVSLLKSL